MTATKSLNSMLLSGIVLAAGTLAHAAPFVENWNYTPDTPLSTAAPSWPLGWFTDSCIVTDAGSTYSARRDPLVGNFIHNNDDGSDIDAEAIYLNHTDYRPAFQGGGATLRLETSVFLGGANADVFWGLGSLPTWAASQVAFDLHAERFQFTIHDAEGVATTHNDFDEFFHLKWWNVRMEILPSANGGNGELDFYYKEPAETEWRQSAVLSDLNLKLLSNSAIDDPYTEWTDQFVRIKRSQGGWNGEGRMGPLLITTVAAPVPATMLLLACGGVLMGLRRNRSRSSKRA